MAEHEGLADRAACGAATAVVPRVFAGCAGGVAVFCQPVLPPHSARGCCLDPSVYLSHDATNPHLRLPWTVPTKLGS